MARSQSRSQRKASGGRYHQSRTKKKTELAGFPANTRLSPETKVRRKGTLGGHAKQSLLTTNVINVSDKKGKTWKEAFAEDWRKKHAWQPGWDYTIE